MIHAFFLTGRITCKDCRKRPRIYRSERNSTPFIDCIGNSELIPRTDCYSKPKSDNSHYVNISGTEKYEYDAIKTGSMFQSDTSFNYQTLPLRPALNTSRVFKKLVESIREGDDYLDYTIDRLHSLNQYGQEKKGYRVACHKGKNLRSFILTSSFQTQPLSCRCCCHSNTIYYYLTNPVLHSITDTLPRQQESHTNTYKHTKAEAKNTLKGCSTQII